MEKEEFIQAWNGKAGKEKMIVINWGRGNFRQWADNFKIDDKANTVKFFDEMQDEGFNWYGEDYTIDDMQEIPLKNIVEVL